MPTEPDDLHAAALAEVARRLKADPGVAALAADRVYGPDDTPAGLPCVIVTKGRSYGPDPGPNRPAQRDVKVECRAADPKVLGMLATAVQTALVGSNGKPAYEHCVLTDTGREDDGDGYVSRVDRFACVCVGTRRPPPPPRPAT